MSPRRGVRSLRLSSLSIVLAAIFLSAVPLQSQGRHGSHGGNDAHGRSVLQDSTSIDMTGAATVTGRNVTAIYINEYACFIPPLNSISPATIGVVDLEVPSKARSEYQTACEALHKKKVAEAEKHLRKAVEGYRKYPAAWVLLGQILELSQKPDEARDACASSLNASSSYLAGYLCLTDISARQKKWDDALKFSNRVLELDPTMNAIAYAYNATANLNLHRLLEAEKSALKALEIDAKNSEPRIHFILAQIYAAKGDRPSTIAQLREFLKFATDPDDIAFVKKDLAILDKQASK